MAIIHALLCESLSLVRLFCVCELVGFLPWHQIGARLEFCLLWVCFISSHGGNWSEIRKQKHLPSLTHTGSTCSDTLQGIHVQAWKATKTSGAKNAVWSDWKGFPVTLFIGFELLTTGPGEKPITDNHSVPNWKKQVVSAKWFKLVVEPTHLKNMRKSNWIIFPSLNGGETEKDLKPPN